MKKLTSKLGLLALAGAIAFGSTSCKKEFVNTDTETRTTTNTNTNTNDSWSGISVYDRKVNYSVVVTAVSEGSFRSPQGVSGATVALAVAGEVKTATTDANGVAAFTDLVDGIASVSVSAAGHAKAHFTADLRDDDVRGGVDNHTTRSASSIITLVPTSGLGTATVTGELTTDDIIQNAISTPGAATTFEDVAAADGAMMTGVVRFDKLTEHGNNWLVHSGVGNVSELYVEGLVASTTDAISTSANGTYSFSIPASAYGVEVQVWANDYIGTKTWKGYLGNDSTSITDYAFTDANATWTGNAYPGRTYTLNVDYR